MAASERTQYQKPPGGAAPSRAIVTSTAIRDDREGSGTEVSYRGGGERKSEEEQGRSKHVGAM